ncbi:hypothetical protein [Pseudotamlana carrageenivorans]|uniref:Uncharacterized protein n=1 Tax=Pseudotamlana carrageenivorans TaxID=2069432 RepID=A0A2I7SHB4_9FLAO|nr:hypothetical protein [Tamlana carrageenivorans]AUS05270.1 hypothetical protein C1A40_07185 [Tamlana carrageenivorans]
MKVYKYQILVILVIILASCQKEDFDLEESKNSIPSSSKIEANVQNGRFVFSSRESFKSSIEQLKQKTVEEIGNNFEHHYEGGGFGRINLLLILKMNY